MNILVLSDTFHPQVNGVTKTLKRLSEHFEETGIHYRMTGPGESSQNLTSNQIAVKGRSFFLYPECRVAIPNAETIEKLLEGFRPDLVHVMTPFSMGFTGYRISKDLNIPLVASYTTHFADYLKHYHLQMLEAPLWSYFKWFHNQADINYCPSSESKALLEEKDIQNLRIWGRGVEFDLFHPEKRRESLRKEWGAEKVPVFTYVGRLAPEKEVPVLLEAVDRLNKLGYKFKTVIVGDGPCREALEDKAPGNVLFAGYQQGEDLAAHYASSDIFAFPSSSETYGNVVLEAMASGLPVIGPEAGGVTENIIHGHNGLYFVPGSPESMTNKMEMLLRQKPLRIQTGQNARIHAGKKNWEQLFEELTGHYEKLIARYQQQLLHSA